MHIRLITSLQHVASQDYRLPAHKTHVIWKNDSAAASWEIQQVGSRTLCLIDWLVVKITKALAASQKEKHTINLASAGAKKNLKLTISIRSAHNWGRKSFLFFGDQPWRATSITLWGNLSQNCQSKDGKKCEIPDHESSPEELRQLASHPGREMCSFDLRLQNMGSWSSRHKLLAEHVARYVWR